MKRTVLCICMILISCFTFTEIHSSQQFYDISFQVVDEKGNGIKGSTFILEQYGEEVVRATSDEKGIVLFSHRLYGEYILFQNSGVSGNDVMDHPITLQMDKKTPKKWILDNVINKCSTGSFSLNIVDKDKVAIAGMKLRIVNEENKVIKTVSTNKDGLVAMSVLPVGKYYLKQASLQGVYTMYDDKIDFMISKDQTYTLQLNFDKAKSDLTDLANQHSLQLFVFISICLCGGSIIYVRRFGWKHFFDHFMI